MKVSLNRMLWAEHNNRRDLMNSIRDEIIDSTPTNIYNLIQGNLYTFTKK